MDRRELAVCQNMAANAAYGGSDSESGGEEQEQQDPEDPGEGTSNGKRKATKPPAPSNTPKRLCLDDLALEQFGVFTAANGANKVFNEMQKELLRISFPDK